MNKTIHSPEIKQAFVKYFNSNNIFLDNILAVATKKYALDIIALDEWLHKKHGYEEEKHGSMQEFITLKFGKEASDFVKELLE